MAVLVALPDLGDEAIRGLIAEWYCPDGASVDAGEVVCRVESAYVAFEVEAESPGLLRHRLVVGSVERAGAILALILEEDENTPSDLPAGDGALGEPPSPFDSREAAFADSSVTVPEPEGYEEWLVQAVVVPFPSKFAGTSQRSLAGVREEPIEFSPAMFGDADHDRIPSLTDPGGSIPGLPLWEPEEHAPTVFAAGPADEAGVRFGRISQEVAESAQVLTVSISVNLVEADRMRTAFEREWRASGQAPLVEDVVFRAIAMAIEETPFACGAAGMLIATRESDLAFAVDAPVSGSFRDAVGGRVGDGTQAFESASWVLVSLAALGVSSATSRLEAGRAMSFALGARDTTPFACLTMSYDSSRWSEGSAARLLFRIRELLDVPYAMLT